MKLRKLKRDKKKKESEYNPHAQRAILEAVDNQLEENDPPEVRDTFNRLRDEGFSELDTKKLIASALVYEMWGIMKEGMIFTRNSGFGVKPLFYFSTTPLHKMPEFYSRWSSAFADDCNRLLYN